LGSVRQRASVRLSVVVPVYGVEPYLADCLDSILGYGGNDLEVVAVDDASPDGCGAILDGYARRDRRVTVVRLIANSGLGAARNAGLSHATGDYVWFVDSDDRLPEGAVAAVLARLAATRPDVLLVEHADVHPGAPRSGDVVVPRTATAELDGATPPLDLADRPQLLRLAQSACTRVARRSLIDAAGLRFHAGWYEDCSFSHPLMLLGSRRIDVLQQVCYLYQHRAGGGITSSRSLRHFEVFDQYERLFAFLDAAGGRYERFRPELFRVMIDHYLVIVGNDQRLPAAEQRRFFAGIVAHYRRFLPPGGYPLPGGLGGLKHRLVREASYPAYATLRRAHRVVSQARGAARPGVRRPAAAADARPTGAE
jgi:CDP-glycerol glycerophosphotransferase